jgi:hypothetical protein
LSDKAAIRARIWAAMQRCELLAALSRQEQAEVKPGEIPAVPRTKLLEELTDDEAQKMADVLAQVLFALGRDTLDGYLEAVQSLRRMPEKPQENDSLLAEYKSLTGQLMPPDLTCRQAFETFWKGAPDVLGRPAEASLADAEGTLFRLARWDGKSRAVYRLEPRSYANEAWRNPVSRSAVKITQPHATSESVAAAYGNVREVTFQTVIADRQGRRAPIAIRIIWDPAASAWVWQWVSVMTDDPIVWPI